MEVSPDQVNQWVDVIGGVFKALTFASSTILSILIFFSKKVRMFLNMGKTVDEIASNVSYVKNSLDEEVVTRMIMFDSHDHIAYFKCNHEGENIEISRGYTLLLGCSKEELMGWKFLNFIPLDEQEEVKKKWLGCLEDCRDYEHVHHIETRTQGKIKVITVVRPVPNKKPPPKVKFWVGYMKKVDENGDVIDYFN